MENLQYPYSVTLNSVGIVALSLRSFFYHMEYLRNDTDTIVKNYRIGVQVCTRILIIMQRTLTSPSTERIRSSRVHRCFVAK